MVPMNGTARRTGKNWRFEFHQEPVHANANLFKGITDAFCRLQSLHPAHRDLRPSCRRSSSVRIFQGFSLWHLKCLTRCDRSWHGGKHDAGWLWFSYQRGFDLTVRFLLSRGGWRIRDGKSRAGAWVRGWEKLHRCRTTYTVITWVNTIALNAYRRVMQREAPSRELPEIVSPHGIDMAIDVHRI